MESFWIGADPGGVGNFGLAFLNDGTDTEDLMTVSSVDDAVAEITKRKGVPRGLGIDAPLWWSTCRAGRRSVDTSLRRKYKISSGTVQTPNSLRGSALLGGVMLAYRVREAFPDTEIGITEAHPKAFLKAMEMGLDPGVTDTWSAEANEHKRDALICAICAREGFEKRWDTDLATRRGSREQDPLAPCFWIAPVHYYWPEPLCGRGIP